MKTWRRLSDRKVVDLESYIKNWMKENPDHKIYIGCDSQDDRGVTTYATVIVLHYLIGGGGHVLYTKSSEKITRPKSERFSSLWKEVELSVETAQELMSFGLPKPDYIDIDLNPDPRWRSNALLRSAVGLVESMGIKARYKHNSPWAISIADTLCK